MVSRLIEEHVTSNRRQLPALEAKKVELAGQLEELRAEHGNVSSWLGGNGLTAQAVGFINGQVAALAERETALQEQSWQVEDQINALAVDSYDATAICDSLADWVHRVRSSDAGERKLLINAVVQNVAVGVRKEVVLTLRPPLQRLGLYPLR